MNGCSSTHVNASGPTPTVTLSANPSSVVAGAASTLTVTASSATQVTVSGSDGSTYTLPGSGGTQSVKPATSTTYTATAVGSGGQATANATVTVSAATNPAPTVAITANPASITSGSSSVLTVTASNATQVVITGNDGSTYTLAAAGGMQTVTPKATATYTATATGAGGSASAAATVTVTAAAVSVPTVTITANPASVISGNSSTLTVAATNATQVTVAGSDGSSYTLAASGGTQTVTPAATTTYTATATGAGGTVSAKATLTVTAAAPTVTIAATPSSITVGSSSTLKVTATNATTVTITGNDSSSYTLAATGGTQPVTPTATTTYTATAVGAGGSVTATAIVTVNPAGSVKSINHVIFMLQENHTFDNYFGMLNPYRKANGWNIGDDGKEYDVDGIDDKLTTTNPNDDNSVNYPLFKLATQCIEDNSSDWLASYGDVYRWSFSTTRPILMDGFVHDAAGYANSCAQPNSGCSGSFPDLTGRSSMGYYDEDYLNYYYYMASQFAVSDRWFSPVASKSIANRIATFTGGTTQGLVKDPGNDDHLPQLDIPNIFEKLDKATPQVSWKIYYTVTQGFCTDEDDCQATGASALYPATDFSNLAYSYQYLYENPTGAACVAPTQASSVVGDASNSFCIDPTHIAPLSTYYTDVANGTLPSFAFIEAGYGNSDEHPGSENSVLKGQAEVAQIVNALMSSNASWSDSIFFFSYDEGGGPYDHVPPVPGHSNDFTDASLGTIPDVASISVNPDVNPNYFPCLAPGGTASTHCDLSTGEPGTTAGDAPLASGFGAQIGFRLPNIIISPWTRKHYVSHTPMDHTAIIKFVEDRFIGDSKYLTQRDAAQPSLLEFFDFNNTPWATPPTPPTPVNYTDYTDYPCNAANPGP